MLNNDLIILNTSNKYNTTRLLELLYCLNIILLELKHFLNIFSFILLFEQSYKLSFYIFVNFY